jgi:lipopolysaccharide biosynthesis glycosyltransferase
MLAHYRSWHRNTRNCNKDLICVCLFGVWFCILFETPGITVGKEQKDLQMIRFISLFNKANRYLNLEKDISLVRSSGLFEEMWYLANNPDVARAKVDPLIHYLHHGGFEGKDPNPNFWSNWYLETYDCVKKAGINPLVYYLKYGKEKGHLTNFGDNDISYENMSNINTHAQSPKRCFVLLASGMDDDYLKRGTLTAIRSIRKTNPDIPVVVLHHDLNLEQQSFFSGTILKQIDLKDFKISHYSKGTRPDMPKAVFLIFFVECIEDFDIAIYVDADAVVLEPLDDLFGMDMPIMGCLKSGLPLAEQFENGQQILHREHISAEYAINNGIVRFDLNFWRANGLLNRADTFRMTDQSLLNLIAYKTQTLMPISRIYNFSLSDMRQMKHSLAYNHLGYLAPCIGEGKVKVVHWNGPLKPWSRDVEKLERNRVALCLECYEQFDIKSVVR